MKSFFEKLKNIILNVIILLLVIFMIIGFYSLVQVKIQNKEYVNIFGFSFFKVMTGSMEPTIKKDDIIFAKITKDVKENDIIVFEKENVIITHRIIKIEENKIITKGDNNNSDDEAIGKSEIIGKVIFTIKNVSIWKKVFSDYRVLIPGGITIFLIVILTAYKEKNSKEEKIL